MDSEEETKAESAHEAEILPMTSGQTLETNEEEIKPIDEEAKGAGYLVVKGAHEPAEAVPRQAQSETNEEKTKVEPQQIDTSPPPAESAEASKDASNVSAERTLPDTAVC